jgi:DNA polymerase-3 subunit beta
VSKFLDPDIAVKVGVKDNNFIVKKDTQTIIIRLLEGEFPQYDDIIRKFEQEHVIEMDRQLFLMMLKRMSILSTDEYRSVIFSLADDRLIVTSTNPDIGESKEQMPITYSGDKIEAAFNPRFFIDALNVMQSESITLNMVNADRPCRMEGEDDPNFITVIMPMRI